MPSLPSPHALAALLLLVAALALFASGRVRIELVCLGVIATIALGSYLFPLSGIGRFSGMQIAFGGFGHEALVAICCLMILGRGLVVTGALEPAARALEQLWRLSPTLGLACSLLVCAGLSMFVNDTPVLVLALPILLSLARRAGIPASKSLMPVNCAILIGGMSTTIGTSTNLLVSSIAADLGVPRFGVFAFTDTVLLAALVAFPYLWLVMPRLLPARTKEEIEAPRRYDAVLHLSAQSPQSTLGELRKALPDLHISALVRYGLGSRFTDASTVIHASDSLVVSGTADQLQAASQAFRASLADPLLLEDIAASARDSGEEERIGHAIVGGDSTLIGQSVKGARIGERYEVAILGATRGAQTPSHSPVAEALDVGDVLLVRGAASRLKALEIGEGLHLLEGATELPQTAKAAWALLIVAGVVALAASKVLPIAIAGLAGTIAMLATGCLRFELIGRALSLQVIVLVASSIALGRALVETGAADWLGGVFALVLRDLPPAAVLGALMLFVTVLTNVVSNAAAAAVGTPLAVSLSSQLHIASEPLVLAVLFGCNLCYVTPMAYQTNLLIMGAARYEFRDFVRAGLPLALLMIGALSWLLVYRYGL